MKIDFPLHMPVATSRETASPLASPLLPKGEASAKGEGRTGLFQVRLNVSATAFSNGEIQPHETGCEYLQ